MSVRMWVSGIVERRLTLELEGQRSPDNADAANQAMDIVAFSSGADRHVIRHLADAVGIQKTRDQDIRRGPVELLLVGAVCSSNLEVAAFLVVQNACENTGGIEMRKAIPVDRTVHPDKRNRVHIADDAIVLDRLIHA